MHPEYGLFAPSNGPSPPGDVMKRSFRKPAPEKEQVLCLPSFHGCPIEDERLLSALENLSDADLELITLYAYEEHDTVEIPRTPHTGRNEPGG